MISLIQPTFAPYIDNVMTTIKYTDVFTKCQMLTDFEGGRLTDGSGETMMGIIALTQQDSPLILEYYDEACNLIASALKFAIESVTPDDTSGNETFGFTWATGNSLNVKSNTEKHLIETISAYCVSKWLENKDAERSKAYLDIYTNMLTAIARQANKVKPSRPTA